MTNLCRTASITHLIMACKEMRQRQPSLASFFERVVTLLSPLMTNTTHGIGGRRMRCLLSSYGQRFSVIQIKQGTVERETYCDQCYVANDHVLCEICGAYVPPQTVIEDLSCVYCALDNFLYFDTAYHLHEDLVRIGYPTWARSHYYIEVDYDGVKRAFTPPGFGKSLIGEVATIGSEYAMVAMPGGSLMQLQRSKCLPAPVTGDTSIRRAVELSRRRLTEDDMRRIHSAKSSCTGQAMMAMLATIIVSKPTRQLLNVSCEC